MSLLKHAQDWAFTLGVTAASRLFGLHDRLTGFKRTCVDAGERLNIASGTRTLEARWLLSTPASPVLLICHGIGETVECWGKAQQYLEAHGISSLVFDYSGYGRSTGRVTASSLDQDLLAACNELRRHIDPSSPIFLLGFSLGSGIAANGAAHLCTPVAGLVLCEAFTTFRNAAHACGVPRWLTWLVPPIWDSATALRSCALPVLVVHSRDDRLFPLEMGFELAQACRTIPAVVRNYPHDGIYRTPDDGYWAGILQWVYDRGTEGDQRRGLESSHEG